FQIGPLIKSLEEAGHQVVKCNLGEPDFNLPEYIKEEIKRQIDLNNTHYCDPQGLLPFRKAIADQINETRGLDISPDQVVVFPGAKPPIGLAQQIYLNQGDEVVYPSPGFPIYESFIGYVGAVPVPLHLKEEEGFSFRGQDLEKLITEKTKLIYLNFPSNPTGAVATKEQLEEIVDVIDRKCPEEVRIYSDEVYEYILFDGSKHLSIASMKNMAKRTIIVSGLSKTFAWTGGRVGYAVFPDPQEAQMFKLFNINYFSCVPPYNQEAARLALESPLRELDPNGALGCARAERQSYYRFFPTPLRQLPVARKPVPWLSPPKIACLETRISLPHPLLSRIARPRPCFWLQTLQSL
ncbi:pyridoxal phosphate-dependent aminotransferase, partial [Candidatus Hakubella thermalkaliphila]